MVMSSNPHDDMLSTILLGYPRSPCREENMLVLSYAFSDKYKIYLLMEFHKPREENMLVLSYAFSDKYKIYLLMEFHKPS